MLFYFFSSSEANNYYDFFGSSGEDTNWIWSKLLLVLGVLFIDKEVILRVLRLFIVSDYDCN